MLTNKEKGDLLEIITAEFCSGISNAKVTNDFPINRQYNSSL